MLRNGSTGVAHGLSRVSSRPASTRSYLNVGLELELRRVTAPSPGRQVEPRRRARPCAGVNPCIVLP